MMMMMMGSVGVKDITFASTEGFLGGGLFIYIYSPFFPRERKVIGRRKGEGI